jgi:hypothetical protein
MAKGNDDWNSRRIERELAGIAVSDGFDRPLGWLQPPVSVSVNGKYLRWTERHAPHRLLRPGRAVLGGFLKLTKASDEGIARYAGRWGMLQLCASHGEYFGHKSGCRPKYLDWNRRTAREPIEAWRRHVRLARAIVNVATSLRNDRPVEFSDWSIMIGWGNPTTNPKEEKSFPLWDKVTHTRTLVIQVNRWIQFSRVQPQLVWEPYGEPHIDFAEEPIVNAISLFGVLGLQLLHAVTASFGFAFCARCDQIYFPEKRRPARGNRNHFCKKCGKKGSWLLSKRRLRRAQRIASETQGRERSDGKSKARA